MPDEPIVVECDQLRIEQVITNLISNAIKYSPPGASVDVAVEPCEGHVAVRVTDRGRGIATEDLDRIFEPFRRVGLSRECVPGVGLGLFVVRRIIEAHRGRIELDSEPGAGSTFRIVLPRSPSSHVALTG
jgi:signal transduction histidine kinase